MARRLLILQPCRVRRHRVRLSMLVLVLLLLLCRVVSAVAGILI